MRCFMSEITIMSAHIPLNEIDKPDILIDDIETFNKIVHYACKLETEDKRFGKTKRVTDADGNTVDMRKKENKDLYQIQTQSTYTKVTERYGVNCYFANSAIRTGTAAMNSQIEQSKLNVENKEDTLTSVKDKCNKLKDELKHLELLKASLIKRSKARKQNKKVPKPKTTKCKNIYYDEKHDVFCLRERHCDPDNKNRKIAWSNDYFFELLYLNPEIKKLKANIKSLTNRCNRLKTEIERLKTEVRGVCFGTRKLMKKRSTVYTDNEVWRSVWQKKRYNPETCILTYHAQNGTDVHMKVEFPYRQELVNKAVKADKKTRHSIAWRFERTHGSILVKCTIYIEPDKRINDYYGEGCVSFDSNVDNISFTETDKYGNLLHHEIIKFDLNGKNSGHRKQILSNALEKVFKYAQEVKKPVACEDLDIKLKGLTYGPKKRNRILTTFAFRQIMELTDSKVYKYSIACKKVKPNYTSQIGKVKFARKYGLSIHEAAAFTIGRRALGIIEKLPLYIRKQLSVKDQKLSRSKQWQKAYKITQKLTVKEVNNLIKLQQEQVHQKVI